MRRSKQWLALLLAITLVASNAVYSLSTSLYANEAGAVEGMAMDGASQDGAPGGLGASSGEGTAPAEEAEPYAEGDGNVMVEEVEDVTPTETTTAPDPTVEETTETDVNGAAGENPDQNPPVEEIVNQEEIYAVTFNWEGSQGSVSGFGDGTVKKGGYLPFTVTAYEGFAIGSVTATGGNLSADFGDENSSQYTLGNINSNTTVNVSFYAKPVETPVETPAVEEDKADAPEIEETKPEVKEPEQTEKETEEVEKPEVQKPVADEEKDELASIKSRNNAKKEHLKIKISGKSIDETYSGETFSTNTDQVEAYGISSKGYVNLGDVGITVTYNGESKTITRAAAGREEVNWTQGQFQITFADEEKYEVEYEIEPLYIDIKKKPITITVDDKDKEYEAEDPEFTGRITSGNLVKSGDLGEITYERSNKNVEEPGTYKGVLTAKYKKNNNYDVTIKPGNFVIKGTKKEKIDVIIYGKSATYYYNGKEQVAKDIDYIELYQGDKMIANKDGISVLKGEELVNVKKTNAGIYSQMGPSDLSEFNLHVPKDSKYDYSVTKFVPGKLVILPRPITITVKDDEKEYGADDPEFKGEISQEKLIDPDTNAEIEGGLVDKNDLGTITYKRNNDAEEAGKYEGVLEAIYTPNPNYDVTVINGDFEIKKQVVDVKIYGKSAKHYYNGKEQVAKDIDHIKLYQGDKLMTENPDGISVSNGESLVYVKETNAGSYKQEVSNGDFELYVPEGSKYDYRVTEFIPGELTILPRPITIKANDAEKMYGTEDPDFSGEVEFSNLTDPDTSETIPGGLVDENDLGEITYKRETQREDVGVYEEEITPDYTQNENYDVTIEKGIFTITPNDSMALSANGYNGIYDGGSHSATVTTNIGNATIQYLEDGEWKDGVPSITNVDSKTFSIRAIANGYEEKKAEVTLEVTPAQLTVVTGSRSKTYDGEALTCLEGAVLEGLVNGETAKVVPTASRTNVGETDNTYKIEWESAKASNYEVVNETLGKLTVVAAPYSVESR